MKKILACLVLSFIAHSAQAVVYTPKFSDFSFYGSQYDVNAGANAYFDTNYGITIDRMYLYRDSRDTFDGIGVANGFVSDIPNPVSGQINFVDGGTDFLSIDYVVLSGNDTVFSAFSSADVLLGSFTISDSSNLNGTRTLFGGGSLISYLTIFSNAGYSAISGLTYNYDGVTDGRNDDVRQVPAPATLALLVIGLCCLRLSHLKLPS